MSDTLQTTTTYTFSRIISWTGEWFNMSCKHIYTLESPQGMVGTLEYAAHRATFKLSERLITTTPVWKWFQPARYVFEENNSYAGEIIKSGWTHESPYFIDLNGNVYYFQKIPSIQGWRDFLWNWRDIWKDFWKRKTHSLVELEHPTGRILYKYPRRRVKSFEGEIEVTGSLQDPLWMLMGFYFQELVWADEEN